MFSDRAEKANRYISRNQNEELEVTRSNERHNPFHTNVLRYFHAFCSSSLVAQQIFFCTIFW